MEDQSYKHMLDYPSEHLASPIRAGPRKPRLHRADNEPQTTLKLDTGINIIEKVEKIVSIGDSACLATHLQNGTDPLRGQASKGLDRSTKTIESLKDVHEAGQSSESLHLSPSVDLKYDENKIKLDGVLELSLFPAGEGTVLPKTTASSCGAGSTVTPPSADSNQSTPKVPDVPFFNGPFSPTTMLLYFHAEHNLPVKSSAVISPTQRDHKHVKSESDPNDHDSFDHGGCLYCENAVSGEPEFLPAEPKVVPVLGPAFEEIPIKKQAPSITRRGSYKEALVALKKEAEVVHKSVWDLLWDPKTGAFCEPTKGNTDNVGIPDERHRPPHFDINTNDSPSLFELPSPTTLLLRRHDPPSPSRKVGQAVSRVSSTATNTFGNPLEPSWQTRDLDLDVNNATRPGAYHSHGEMKLHFEDDGSDTDEAETPAVDQYAASAMKALGVTKKELPVLTNRARDIKATGQTRNAGQAVSGVSSTATNSFGNSLGLSRESNLDVNNATRPGAYHGHHETKLHFEDDGYDTDEAETPAVDEHAALAMKALGATKKELPLLTHRARALQILEGHRGNEEVARKVDSNGKKDPSEGFTGVEKEGRVYGYSTKSQIPARSLVKPGGSFEQIHESTETLDSTSIETLGQVGIHGNGGGSIPGLKRTREARSERLKGAQSTVISISQGNYKTCAIIGSSGQGDVEKKEDEGGGKKLASDATSVKPLSESLGIAATKSGWRVGE